MRAPVLYGPKDLRFEEREAPSVGARLSIPRLPTRARLHGSNSLSRNVDNGPLRVWPHSWHQLLQYPSAFHLRNR